MLPRLLNPVKVQIKKSEKSETFYDDDLREPIGQVTRANVPITVWAQIKTVDDDNPQASVGGPLETTRGYILVKSSDLKKLRFTLDRGDQIIKIGEGDFARNTNYYITKFQHRGHYQSAGGNTLIKAWFADRHPSRQSGDL